MFIYLTVDDYRKRAGNNLSKLARDYYESGADDEETLKRNESAFKSFLIRPHCLTDVSNIGTSVSWYGSNLAFPIGIAPTAFHKLADEDGELSTVQGAAASGSPMICSSWSTVPLEEIAEKGRPLGATVWFQLYVYKDRALSTSIIRRAEKAGFKALVLTVDTPVLGRRLADNRNGFKLPSPLKMANFEGTYAESMPSAEIDQSGLMGYVSSQTDSTLNWDSLDWLVRTTTLPVIVKGIMRGDDAERAVQHGAKGIIVSNHGGRQMDSAPATIECLAEVVRAVNGRCPVFLDGGIRNGRDIFKALALGAQGIFVGRPVLWALTCQGAAGVSNVMGILQRELIQTMKLAGCLSIEEIQKAKDIVVKESYYSKL